MQFASRRQYRLKKFLHDLFRYAVEIEIRLFGDFPEFIQAARPGAFERQHLNKQIQHISSLNEPRLETIALIVIGIKICVQASIINAIDDI
jgi:hypothetical protein